MTEIVEPLGGGTDAPVTVEESAAPASIGEALAAVTARHTAGGTPVETVQTPTVEPEPAGEPTWAEMRAEIDRHAHERADAMLAEELDVLAAELGVDRWQLETLRQAASDPVAFREQIEREQRLAQINAEDRASDIHAEGDRQARELIAGWTDELGDLDADEVLAQAEALWPQIERDVQALRLRFGPGVNEIIGPDEEVAAAVVRWAAEDAAAVVDGERQTSELLGDLERRYGAFDPYQVRQEAEALLPHVARTVEDSRRAAVESLEVAARRATGGGRMRGMADLHSVTRYHAARARADAPQPVAQMETRSSVRRLSEVTEKHAKLLRGEAAPTTGGR